MARKQNDADTELVRCAIKRTACAYNEQGLTVNCDNRATDTTFLHGYTVTIRVLRYDKNFAFWRGVSKCEVESVESDVPLAAGDIFYEKIIMMHEPIDTFSADDYGKIAIITLTLFVIMYAALYFFRRKHCEYCQQKLVFSRRLCYKCVLVGAQPPDPVLLKALEERGENMQGTLPKRLGFVQLWFENCGKCLYSCFTCQCCCNCCCVCFRFCCCCGCCSYCCGCQKKDEHKTIPEDDCAMMAVEAIELGEGLSMTRDDVEDFTQSLDDERDESKTRKKPRKKGVKTVDPPVVGQTEGVTADMKKKKKRNPNILDQPPEIIYKAVKLPYNL